MKKLFEEWKIAFLAKGWRKITAHDEELFNDFFQWLQWKEASNDKKICPKCGCIYMQKRPSAPDTDWVCARCNEPVKFQEV